MATPKEVKTATNNALETTKAERAARILDINGLGDNTPSQCLNNMLALVPEGQEPGFLFKEVFLRQLPIDVRAHLQGANKKMDPLPDKFTPFLTNFPSNF